MPFHRLLLAAAVLLALTLGASSAHAQVTLGPTVTLAPDLDRGNRTNKQFNRADCAADVQLTFPIVVSGANGTIFEIWVGTGCDTKEGREKVPAECWKVRAEEAQVGTSRSYTVPIRHVVKRATIANDDMSGPEGCDEAPGVVGSGPQKVQIAFVAMDTARTQIGFAKWELEYDLIAPDPPANLRAGPGESALSVTFDGKEATDADGFTFYCEIAGGTPSGVGGAGGASAGAASVGSAGAGGTGAAAAGASNAASGGDTGGSADAGGTSGASGADGMSGAGGTSGAGGADGMSGAGGVGVMDTGGASGSSSSGGTARGSTAAAPGSAATGGSSSGDVAADPNCTSASLVPGQLAPEGYEECGSTGKLATSGRTSENLENGVRYVVAAAAKDAFGNRGKLSALACATPAEVTGFFEAYRDAGGQAGGGFCSFSAPRRGALGLWLILAIGGAALVRRRR